MLVSADIIIKKSKNINIDNIAEMLRYRNTDALHVCNNWRKNILLIRQIADRTPNPIMRKKSQIHQSFANKSKNNNHAFEGYQFLLYVN